MTDIKEEPKDIVKEEPKEALVQLSLNIMLAQDGTDLMSEMLIITDITMEGLMSSLATWLAPRAEHKLDLLPESAWIAKPVSNWPRDRLLCIHPKWMAWLWLSTAMEEVQAHEKNRILVEQIEQVRKMLDEQKSGSITGVV